MNDNRFLLHVCCAPCAPHPLRTLKKEFALTLYFFNPNIHPKKEYKRRLDETRKLAEAEGVALVEGKYRPAAWLLKARQWKDEPEKGKRCEACIGARMDEAARKAKELGIRRFGTVLSISRRKSSIMVNRMGGLAAKKFPGIAFSEADWKKAHGERFSEKISAEYGFERQNYCGCVYSRIQAREKEKRRAAECATK